MPHVQPTDRIEFRMMDVRENKILLYYANCLLVLCKLSAGTMQIVCWYYANCLLVLCKLSAGTMQMRSCAPKREH